MRNAFCNSYTGRIRIFFTMECAETPNALRTFGSASKSFRYSIEPRLLHPGKSTINFDIQGEPSPCAARWEVQMFSPNKFGALVTFFAIMAAGITPSSAERTDRGIQVIDGTIVNTTIYHERGYAIFENDCGSQRLSQSALQGGAKPTDIIPCSPISNETSNPPAAANPPQQRLWAAAAAGISNGLLGVGSRVSVGLGSDHETKAEAEAAAIRSCQKNGVSCSVVTSWNSGCYFITVSRNANNVVWGGGRTAQAAYNECYKRIDGGNCDTETLGGCYPE